MRVRSTCLAALAAILLAPGCGWTPPKVNHYGRDVGDPVVVSRSGATAVRAVTRARAGLDTKLVLACAKLWNATSTDRQLSGFARVAGDGVLVGTWKGPSRTIAAAVPPEPSVRVRHGDCVAVRGAGRPAATAFVRQGRAWAEVRSDGLDDARMLAVDRVLVGATAWPRSDGSIGQVLDQR